MKIIIVKNERDVHGMTTFLRQIEKAITGPNTEFDSEGIQNFNDVGVLSIKKVRTIAIPTKRTIEL